MPATPFVAAFVGVANLVPATVARGLAATPLGPVRLIEGPTDGSALVVVRPEHVRLEPASDPGAGGVGGRIAARRFAGAELHYEVVLDDGLRVWVAAGAAARHLTVGDDVRLNMRSVETVGFTPTSADLT